MSVANVIYILRKQLDPKKTKKLILTLSNVFEIDDLKFSDMESAANLYANDYEDAIQMCCAERIGADYIITRNVKDFKDSRVPAVEPKEFVKNFS